MFLPDGFPSSVSPDYLRYQLFDTLQAFCSSLSGQLSTHAVLRGVGVGDASATALAATLTYLARDFTGHVGRILFAWRLSHSLDADARFWRLVADVLNDVALGIEVLVIPLARPEYLLVVLCLSALLKAVVGVAGGATRAALTLHQARRNNMADVAAKDGSQETAVRVISTLSK